jgi:hypothetical protein
MLRQIQIQIEKINKKIKSNNIYFYFFLILVSYNYIILYNYLLDNNYNIILFYFIYFFILYIIFGYFSNIIIFITLNILKLFNIDNYIKNRTIIENHEPASVVNYRTQQRLRQQQRRRQQRQNRPRNAIYQGAGAGGGANIGNEEDTLESRAQATADREGEEAKTEAIAVESSGPPDPAYQYITTHMPECSRELISVNSLPIDPKYTQPLP